MKHKFGPLPTASNSKKNNKKSTMTKKNIDNEKDKQPHPPDNEKKTSSTSKNGNYISTNINKPATIKNIIVEKDKDKQPHPPDNAKKTSSSSKKGNNISTNVKNSTIMKNNKDKQSHLSDNKKNESISTLSQSKKLPPKNSSTHVLSITKPKEYIEILEDSPAQKNTVVDLCISPPISKDNINKKNNPDVPIITFNPNYGLKWFKSNDVFLSSLPVCQDNDIKAMVSLFNKKNKATCQT